MEGGSSARFFSALGSEARREGSAVRYKLIIISKMQSELKRTRSRVQRKRKNHNMPSALESQELLEGRLDEFESDYYEEPNLYTENISDDEFEEKDPLAKNKKDNRYNKQKALSKTKKIQKIQSKKAKNNLYIKQNFNLKKIVIQQHIDNQAMGDVPLSLQNFDSQRASRPIYPSRKFCCVCNRVSGYVCPKCKESYCNLKCYALHREIRCLKFSL